MNSIQLLIYLIPSYYLFIGLGVKLCHSNYSEIIYLKKNYGKEKVWKRTCVFHV